MATKPDGTKAKGKRIGDLQKVKNQKRKLGAAEEYHHIRAQLMDGDEISLLFTERELKVARERAIKNPEDCPEVSCLRNIFD